MAKTGFQSRGSRFGMGIGVLSVSRGYGPITFEPFVPEPPPKLKEGGDGPTLVVVDPAGQPKTILVKPEAKKKC